MLVLLPIIIYLVIAAFSYAIQDRFDPFDFNDEGLTIILSMVWPLTLIGLFVYGLTKIFIYMLNKIFPRETD